MRPTLLCKNSIRLAGIVLAMLFAATAALGQTSGFTYQGRLTDGGTPANGNYDLQFALWDSLSGGAQVGSPQSLNTVAVSNGVFTVSLDFGANAFPGASRFLEIGARPAGSGSFTLLAPRQPITSTPYAVRSASAGNADTATNATNAATASNATQLGGVAASQFVQSNDSRLSDARPPTAGSSNYIQNSTGGQTANFKISGSGEIGGSLIAGGNVGVGTNAPNAALHVSRPVPVLALQDSDDGVSGQVGVMSFRNSSGVETGWLGFGSSGDANATFMNNRTGGSTALGTAAVERLIVTAAGSVGIGTASPSATLDVRGNIRFGSVGQFFPPAGEENLRIIRGYINFGAGVFAGSGWNATRNSEGRYAITFAVPFTGLPTVTATADTTGQSVFRPTGTKISAVLPTSFVLDVFQTDDCCTFLDRPFHFIAIGPR